MFVVYNEKVHEKPIKIWLRSKEDIEDSCLQQANNLSNLPFIHKWVALMPDTHTGKGMPIGGVIAADGVVIPHAVGSDIGCGMIFIQTNIRAEVLKNTMTGSGSLLQLIIGEILRNTPVGAAHHKKMQSSMVLDEATKNIEKYIKAPTLLPQIEDAYYQMGTLGGGNHFIELQEDEEGMVAIMIHTGSRHLGNRIGDYFNNIAKELNKKWYSKVPEEYNLAFLPVMSDEGRLYIEYMNLALDFAQENREVLLNSVIDVLTKRVEKYCNFIPEYTHKINAHHNYASLGILGYEKDGKTGYYFLKDHILSKLPSATLEHLTEALLFFQNTLPLGILGNFILQKASHKSNIFAFRDLHFTHTLEDEIMLSLFCAIKNHNKILLVHPSLKENYVLPIKILDNIKQGRRYVIVYHYNANKYLFYRLDNIYKVNILEDIDPGFSTKLSIVNVLLENSWGVSFINPESPTLEKWVLTLHIDDQKEKYLLKQIEKENKEGTLNKLSKNTYLYTINVLDANEMAPWIRSFTGRILDIKCTNQEVLGRIIHDVKLMKSYYEEDDYGAI
jgi:hypothetical protein